MRNEDELARNHSEYGKMSGTEKSLQTNGYMEDLVKPKPVIDEKRLHEQLTDRITEISEIFEADDITSTVYGNGIRFGLDFDGYKVKFEGGITGYRDVSRIGSGAYTYLFDVSGKAEIYNGDKKVRVVEYNEVDFEAEFIYNEMSYFGCKESDF